MTRRKVVPQKEETPTSQPISKKDFINALIKKKQKNLYLIR